jgi:hypothetical protein
MRRLTLAIAALVALTAASIAVAHGIDGAKTASAVSATFSAAPSGTVTTRTCTTTDNKTITIADGRYTGSATSSNAALQGGVTIRARSVINTTDNVGTVTGAYRIHVANGGDTVGAFTTVYDHGAIAGWTEGRAHAPAGRVLGNLSAAFSATGTGFQSGKIGGGTSAGSAVALGPTSCRPTSPPADRSEARGTVTAISAGSITVAQLTCVIPSAMSADVNNRIKLNDRAEIHCSVQSGQNTLTRADKLR